MTLSIHGVDMKESIINLIGSSCASGLSLGLSNCAWNSMERFFRNDIYNYVFEELTDKCDVIDESITHEIKVRPSRLVLGRTTITP